MGSDMANVKNSNLKVPPLKIVLSATTSGGSDRSSSTSPSSESESLDSNLTIISDNQHDRSSASRADLKEDTAHGKHDRAPKGSIKGSVSDRNSSTTTVLSSKRLHDNSCSSDDKMNNGDVAAGREQASSSNQRITRSSQRAAQQNKSENLNETNGDETTVTEAQDKTIDSARKVKRRKGEPQDSEQDSNQQVPPPPLVMANICPADYELPSQNSFELYRDIRKRPYKKLMKLSNIQPKVPYGFKDYLVNSGPYLLDGNRIGTGIKGGLDTICTETLRANSSQLSNRIPSKLKYTNHHPKFPISLVDRRDYDIPRLLEVPENLKQGSPLYELFQDQEKSRQKMRLQHLKERERSILTAEQEVLRAYNRAAIVDSKEGLNLSACSYFYLQERYHYMDEKNDSIDCVNPKDLIPNQTNLDDGGKGNEQASQQSSQDSEAQIGGQPESASNISNLTDEVAESHVKSETSEHRSNGPAAQTNGINDTKPSQKRRKKTSDSQNGVEEEVEHVGPGHAKESLGGDMDTKKGKTCDTDSEAVSKPVEQLVDKETGFELRVDCDKTECSPSETFDTVSKTTGEYRSDELSSADQPAINKSAFLDTLQEIDEKWARIKREMLIRHKNEADSLFAVQSLDWEWKAKEIGACDVRVALKIEPEFVPRVEVSFLDY